MKAPKATAFHIPVMYQAVAEWAAGSRRAVDATAGGGGHTALLRAAGALVLAIDRDPAALAAAQAALGSSGITWLEASFASDQALAAVREFRPDRILLDLGVSSHQLDDEARGFSFRPGAPLDMRMTPGKGPRGADVLNTWSEELLETAFRDSADEPRARALARTVVRRRRRAAFTTSDDFVNAIREVLGPRSGPSDFARLFQAVRIAVNDEGGQLARALPALRDALVPGGRLGVISYHSGEDRVVKQAFRDWARACVCPPGQPVCTCRGRPLGTLLTKKAVMPEASEIAANVRARSAKFRAFATESGSDGA
ncbi:MAG: 16S rRNA (cytosine(1402)-N(4))-methyltransferase RsmH [Acidobacteriota bacterium]